MSVAISQKLYKPVAIAAALAFLYFTVLTKLGRVWVRGENYSHGLLIPFIIGFILWQERKSFFAEEDWSASVSLAATAEIKPQAGRLRSSHASLWFGATLVVFALFALWAGTAGAELFVQRVS